MAKRKFTAVIYRFSKPLADGSFGVVIFDRDKTWKPTKKDNARIDALCEGACDMVDKDVLPPGGIGVAIDGEASDADFERIDTDAFIAEGHAGRRYIVGLFPSDFVHAEHGTVQ